jgi:hypothetical protein
VRTGGPSACGGRGGNEINTPRRLPGTATVLFRRMLFLVSRNDQFGLFNLALETFDLGLRLGKNVTASRIARHQFFDQSPILGYLLSVPIDFSVAIRAALFVCHQIITSGRAYGLRSPRRLFARNWPKTQRTLELI